jgi:hypothetical protein
MRRPLLGLLLASTLLSSRPALADPPPAPPLAPPAPTAPPSYAPPPAAPWAAPLAVTSRRSSGAMITGVVLASIGALGMGIGTAIYTDAAGSCSDSFEFDRASCLRSSSDGKLVGMTVLLSSAAVAAVGVPLWIFGAQKVVAPPDQQPSLRAVSVRLGPASASLHLSF